jgi:hypothetical protein
MSSTSCTNCGYAMVKDIEIPATPVPELLGSCVMLSAPQTRMVRDTLCTTQSRISKIDNEITRLMNSVKELQSKRDTLLTYAEMHTILLAPIQRLPPEILAAIFLNCMETKWFNPRYYHFRPRLDKAPLLLGHVCSRWRSITLSTPRLWASFTLTIQPKYLKLDVPLAKTWFGRSGTCPLFIKLGSAGNYNYQDSMRPLMEVFLSHCKRWHTVHLDLPLPVICSLAPARNRLTCLQSLFIDGQWKNTVDTFEYAPQLRYVSLASHIAPSEVKIPWNQLRYCRLGGDRRIESCLELLRLTPNLEECAVSLLDHLPYPHSPVQLSRLHSIHIRGHPAFLEKLLVPELHEVSIRLSRVPWTAALTSLFLRCSIRKFSVRTIASSILRDDEMIQVLQASPTLVELELRDHSSCVMTTSFLAQFAYNQSSGNLKVPPLVPTLQTLRVDYTPSHFDIAEFVDAIQFRMIFDSFKRVEICHTADIAEPFESVTMMRLRKLNEIGLDINVLYRG